MAKRPDQRTVTGRWPVAVQDIDGRSVPAGQPATVAAAKAAEFDGRFGRLPEPAGQAEREA